MPRKLENNYDIEAIKQLRNSLNPKTGENYSFREIAKRLEYTSHVLMMAWLKRNYSIALERQATYKFTKLSKLSKILKNN